MCLLSSLDSTPSSKILIGTVDLGKIQPNMTESCHDVMKKLLIKILVILAVLGVIAIIGIALFLNSIIKKGVETVGPRVAQVEVKLDGVNVSVFSGKGEIKGLVVGNPPGFSTPNAIKVGKAGIAVNPTSVLSDKVIIESVTIEAPEITVEGGLKDNNLTKIMANIDSVVGKSGQGAPPPTGDQKPKPARKLQVNNFAISGGKITLHLAMLGGQSTTVPLPDIHFKDLGQGPEGITSADLMKMVMQTVTDDAIKAAVKALANQGKGFLDAAKILGQGTTNSVGNATKTIGDLFKKKK
jgi:hypothetical protein